MAIETQASSLETTGLDFQGELVAPGDPGCDDARRIWNGAIDRRPGLIARCTGVADVVAAVRFARERDLLVAVHGGGHGVGGHAGGHAVCEGGLVIDLSPMKGVWVDPVARTARAEPGVLWGELDRETQLHGLAMDRHAHGHRRPHARRGDRLAHAQVRGDRRQPALGRPRNCGRRACARQRRGEPVVAKLKGV